MKSLVKVAAVLAVAGYWHGGGFAFAVFWSGCSLAVHMRGFNGTCIFTLVAFAYFMFTGTFIEAMLFTWLIGMSGRRGG